jgi:hypothetical protein
MRCLPTPDCVDGAAAINLSGSVTGVYAVGGGLTAALALAFSPVAHGDRYLEGAAGRRAGSAGAGHSPGSGAAEREGAGHGPGSLGTGPAGDPPTLAEARTGAKRSADTSVERCPPRHRGPPVGRAPIGNLQDSQLRRVPTGRGVGVTRARSGDRHWMDGARAVACLFRPGHYRLACAPQSAMFVIPGVAMVAVLTDGGNNRPERAP